MSVNLIDSPAIVEQCVEKPRGIMVNGVPREVPRPKSKGAAGPKGFGRGTSPRDSIHHDTPKALPHIFILYSSRTSKEGFLSVNGLFKEYRG